jgi:fused signal recognition particle receptor
MFGKIKDRLKNVFNKSEEVIEESPEEELSEEPIEEVKKEETLEKKPKKEKPKKEKTEKKEEEKEEDKQEEFEEINKEISKKDTKEDTSENVEEVSQVEEQVKEEEAPEESVEEDLEERDEKTEELIEESPEEEFSEEEPEEKEEKKGFFSRVFSKKEKEEPEEDELTKGEDEKDEDLESQEDIVEEKDIEEKKDTKEDLEEKEETSKESLEKPEEKEEKGFFKKTFGKLSSKKISEGDFQKIWLELEIFLLEINIAYEIVSRIEKRLKETVVHSSFDRFSLSDAIRKVMTEEVEKVLVQREANFLEKIKEELKVESPLPLLVLGVNGTGKTTTLAKMVHYFKKNDISCVLAAADTFRAAAREQLEEHAKKLEVKLIQHKSGSDPAAVAYDALEHAKAKKIDLVLIDTAGRMPNNSNLMMELQKVARVSKARMSVFIGDSISGNDLIEQIELFSQGVSIDGIILTKVDTDEKPGSVVTAAYSIEKPIFFLGVGQTYDDLIEFNAKHIAEELFKLD